MLLTLLFGMEPSAVIVSRKVNRQGSNCECKSSFDCILFYGKAISRKTKVSLA